MHSVTGIYAVFLITAFAVFYLLRQIPRRQFVLKVIFKLPLFLILTMVIAFLILNLNKNQFLDLHTNHS